FYLTTFWSSFDRNSSASFSNLVSKYLIQQLVFKQFKFIESFNILKLFICLFSNHSARVPSIKIPDLCVKFPPIMKFVYTFLFLACTTAILFAQQGNPNTLTVSVDDKPYETEPRRIRIGHVAYVTGNKVGPDQSLRIWLGAVDGREITESGTYLIIGENETGKKDPAMQEFNTGKYKGIAYIKWVEETK